MSLLLQLWLLLDPSTSSFPVPVASLPQQGRLLLSILLQYSLLLSFQAVDMFFPKLSCMCQVEQCSAFSATQSEVTLSRLTWLKKCCSCSLAKFMQSCSKRFTAKFSKPKISKMPKKMGRRAHRGGCSPCLQITVYTNTQLNFLSHSSCGTGKKQLRETPVADLTQLGELVKRRSTPTWLLC